MSDGRAPARLAIRGLAKSFGGVRALADVDLAVGPGEIHGLLGKNGSGKSTLIKILSGFHRPDSGTLEIDGAPVPLPIAPGAGEAAGLSFVHQNLGLLPDASVLENLIAGDRQRLNRWHIDWRREAARAKGLFEAHGLALDPHAPVADLSPVERAQLAIARAADRIAAARAGAAGGILVLDEPTPFLPIEDVRHLFALMRRLASGGVSIVFVSHDIDEVMEITGRATVLRDGHVVGRFSTAATPRAAIVEAIVGRALVEARLVGEAPPASNGAARVAVRGLAGRTVAGVDLDVAPGEILGLTGLVGSGYDEVPRLLAGAATARDGSLDLGQGAVPLRGLTPARAIAGGVAFIPADRQRAGLALDLSLAENAMLPFDARGHDRFRIRHADRRRRTAELMRRFVVKAERPDQPAAELSGGNQQKILLAKWLQLSPKLVLLDEPTQGIDVGARREIYERLFEACAAGAAILCATSEFEELEAVAHRVLVFERGRVKVELRGTAITKSAIEAAAYGETRVHATV